MEGTHSRATGSRRFRTIPERCADGAFSRYDTVALPNGIKIHYIYDEPFNDTAHNRSISGSIQSALSTCAVISQGEMYDVLTGRSWTIEAPSFGIPFGAKHISVHIELPDDFDVRPEGYRQFLRYVDGEQDQVESRDFASQVLEHRPEWLIELIHSLAPNTGDSSDEIRNKLQDFLNRLRVRAVTPRVGPTGDLEVNPDIGRAASEGRNRGEVGDRGDRKPSKPDDLAVVTSGAQMARLMKNMERAPQLIPLDDKEHIEDKQIVGRAARYYPKTGELFINMRYPAVSQMFDQLSREYAQAPDPELMQQMAQSHSRNAIMQRVGMAVVFALAKRLNKEWDESDMQKALEPESLSIAADNFYESLQDARRSIGKALKLKRQDVDQEAGKVA